MKGFKMSNELRDKVHQLTTSEHIEGFVSELKNDRVGLWDIIRSGRGEFEFTGKQLHDFIHLVIKTLIENGGVVGDDANSTKIIHIPTMRYGTKPDEIARAVLDEWIKAGEPDIDPWTGLVFVTEEFFTSTDNIRVVDRSKWKIE
jgi:hypothetical protein